MIIYKVTNKVNGKIYIGQTVRTLEQRKWQHLDAAKNGCKTHFYNAIRKYGEDNFVFEIIDEASSLEELNVYCVSIVRQHKMGYAPLTRKYPEVCEDCTKKIVKFIDNLEAEN